MHVFTKCVGCIFIWIRTNAHDLSSECEIKQPQLSALSFKEQQKTVAHPCQVYVITSPAILLERVESFAEHKNFAGVNRVEKTPEGSDVELSVSVSLEEVSSIFNGMTLCTAANAAQQCCSYRERQNRLERFVGCLRSDSDSQFAQLAPAL
jgi:hypothetical protein